jgi:hypothetical protein
MLTHHMQDPNGEPLSYFKSCVNSGYNGGKKYDDASYSSERQKQSKREKMEMEISRLIEKNDGKIFLVKYEKAGSKDDHYSEDYE